MKDTHISAYELMKKVPNRFLLTIASSRRARQIKEGANPLVDEVNPEQPVISSLYEILEDKVGVELKEIDEKERKRMEMARRKKEEETERDSIRERKDSKPRKETKSKKREVERGRRKKKSRSLAA